MIQRLGVLVLILACAAGCVTKGRFNAEVARNHALDLELEKCSAKANELAFSREQLTVEKKRLDQERSNLIREIQKAHSGNQALKDALDAEQAARVAKEVEIVEMSTTYKGLVEDLQKELKSGEIEIEELRGRLQVRALDQILFASGSAEIKPDGRAVLAKVAAQLAKLKDREIRVEGHTDNVPIATARFASNWELSSARATSVVRLLVGAGVAAHQVSAAGYGEFHPIEANSTAQGRQRNRRIEIVLAAPRTE